MVDTVEPAFKTIRIPLVPRLAMLHEARPITPRTIRLILGGSDLAGFRTLSPPDHVRLLPPVQGEPPAMPTAGTNGLEFPAGKSRPHMRDYTPRRFDERLAQLEIDVVVHGAGLVADWARRAVPGDRVWLLGPRGSHVLARSFAWYLLIGDETGLPTIARWLEEMPADARAMAIVEVEDEAEEQTIETSADAAVTWVRRKGAAPGNPIFLLDALRDLTIPDGDGMAWIGGEATTMRPLRRHLIEERGIDRDAVHFSGHWKRGVADWDHHGAIEV